MLKEKKVSRSSHQSVGANVSESTAVGTAPNYERWLEPALYYSSRNSLKSTVHIIFKCFGPPNRVFEAFIPRIHGSRFPCLHWANPPPISIICLLISYLESYFENCGLSITWVSIFLNDLFFCCRWNRSSLQRYNPLYLTN